MIRAVAAVVLLAVLAPPSHGQLGPGITWSGTSGTFTGSFGFQCEPLQVAVNPGETVTLGVWGDYLSPFVVMASFGATSCRHVPGVHHGFLLGHPATITAVGQLDQFNSCGGPCPTGVGAVTVPVAPTLPPGTAITVQVVTLMDGVPAFTCAITATAQ